MFTPSTIFTPFSLLFIFNYGVNHFDQLEQSRKWCVNRGTVDVCIRSMKLVFLSNSTVKDDHHSHFTRTVKSVVCFWFNHTLSQSPWVVVLTVNHFLQPGCVYSTAQTICVTRGVRNPGSQVKLFGSTDFNASGNSVALKDNVCSRCSEGD